MVKPSSEALRWLSLLAATLIVSVLFIDMVQSFLVALILAAIAAAMAAPLQARMMILTRHRKPLAAGLTLLILAVSVVAPLIGIIFLAVDQAQGMSSAADALVEELRTLAEDESIPEWVPFHDQLGQYSAQITAKIGELAETAGEFLVSALGEATRGTAKFFLDLFVFFYALFIFLQMDRLAIDQILAYSGLELNTRITLRDRMMSISRATVKGTLLIGVAQGALGALGFWGAGIEGAAFWGVVMAVLSVIPGIGPLLIVFFGVIWLFAQGETGSAIGLAIWGFAVVGTIDNILRPILVGRDAAMNDILILISTLGGLTAFGAAGLVLGPVLAGLFVTLWDTLSEVQKEPMPDDPPLEPPPESSLLDDELAHDLDELRQRKAERSAEPPE